MLVAVVVACVAFRSARVSLDYRSDSRCNISVRKDRGAPGATVRISWTVSNRIITSQPRPYTIQGDFRSLTKERVVESFARLNDRALYRALLSCAIDSSIGRTIDRSVL